MPRAPSKGRRVESAEPEVPLQVTIPKRVTQALDLKSVETGRTRRALVLQSVQQFKPAGRTAQNAAPAPRLPTEA